MILAPAVQEKNTKNAVAITETAQFLQITHPALLRHA